MIHFRLIRRPSLVGAVVCGVLVLCCLGPFLRVANAQTKEDKSKAEVRPRGVERFRKLSRIKGSRRIVLQPTRVTDGISTGLVIAYGHVILPPYHVEWQGGKLVINGVQVQPSMVREKERRKAPPALTDEQRNRFRRQDDVESVAQEMYRKGIRSKSLEAVQAEILEYVRTSSGAFTNPKWSGKDALEVQLAGIGIQYTIVFSAKQHVKLSEDEKRNREETGARKAKEAALTSVEKGLRAGSTLVFYSDGSEGGGIGDIRAKVNEIMTDSGLSKEQRVEMLQERVFHDYEGALDVIENYDPDEWKPR